MITCLVQGGGVSVTIADGEEQEEEEEEVNGGWDELQVADIEIAGKSVADCGQLF